MFSSCVYRFKSSLNLNFFFQKTGKQNILGKKKINNKKTQKKILKELQEKKKLTHKTIF